ncbi:MAG: hypothetical protein RLZZ292_1867, partial [Bacteroidota bacterium]
PKYIKRISKSHAVSVLKIKNINIADQTVSLNANLKTKPLDIGAVYYKEFKESLPMF